MHRSRLLLRGALVNREPTGTSYFRRALVHDAELKPQHLRTDRHGIVSDLRCLFGRPEDVDDIDRTLAVAQ